MKTAITILIISVLIGFPLQAQALTATQANAIIGLLRAFNVDNSTLQTIQGILYASVTTINVPAGLPVEEKVVDQPKEEIARETRIWCDGVSLFIEGRKVNSNLFAGTRGYYFNDWSVTEDFESNGIIKTRVGYNCEERKL